MRCSLGSKISGKPEKQGRNGFAFREEEKGERVNLLTEKAMLGAMDRTSSKEGGHLEMMTTYSLHILYIYLKNVLPIYPSTTPVLSPPFPHPSLSGQETKTAPLSLSDPLLLPLPLPGLFCFVTGGQRRYGGEGEESGNPHLPVHYCRIKGRKFFFLLLLSSFFSPPRKNFPSLSPPPSSPS